MRASKHCQKTFSTDDDLEEEIQTKQAISSEEANGDHNQAKET